MITDPAPEPLDDADNPNVLVVGMIGGGKSYLLRAPLVSVHTSPPPGIPAVPLAGDLS